MFRITLTEGFDLEIVKDLIMIWPEKGLHYEFHLSSYNPNIGNLTPGNWSISVIG